MEKRETKVGHGSWIIYKRFVERRTKLNGLRKKYVKFLGGGG